MTNPGKLATTGPFCSPPSTCHEQKNFCNRGTSWRTCLLKNFRWQNVGENFDRFFCNYYPRALTIQNRPMCVTASCAKPTKNHIQGETAIFRANSAYCPPPNLVGHGQFSEVCHLGMKIVIFWPLQWSRIRFHFFHSKISLSEGMATKTGGCPTILRYAVYRKSYVSTVLWERRWWFKRNSKIDGYSTISCEWLFQISQKTQVFLAVSPWK